MYDDDRPRKSWREIDSMREKSYHRRDNTAGSGRPRSRKEEYESRRYKSELEKIFSGGSLPPSFAERLTETPASEQSKKRHGLIQKIRNEEDVEKLHKELSELYDIDNGFPKLEDILLPAVEHPDSKLSLAAMAGLKELHSDPGLKRKSLLRIKLRSLSNLCEDPDVKAAAQELLDIID